MASDVGAGARRALLLHGNPSHLDHWIHTVPALRGRAEVLAYDQPGLGRSGDFADAQQSLERSVDVALAVLDHAGWSGPVDLLGQSHGGLIAVALAARAPERVRSLVLLGTGGTPSHGTYRLFLLPGLDRALLALGRAMAPNAKRRLRHSAPTPMDERPEELVGSRAGRTGALVKRSAAAVIRMGARGSFAPDSVPASVVEEGLRAPPTILRAMVRLAHDRPCEKVAVYAPRVRAPVLFIHGREDRLVHVSYARRLFEIMRAAGLDARFEEVDGGHMVHLSRPQSVNPLLAGWLAS